MGKGKKRPKRSERKPRASEASSDPEPARAQDRHDSPADGPLPRWDKPAGELWFRDQLMLSFEKKAAPMEETLLDAWEAANWIGGIFDPIEHDSQDVPEKQLENAVSRLNKALRSRWMRFHVRDHRFARWEDCHPDARHARSRQRRPR